MNYEAVIGLEVHAQLKTKSKMFCACPTISTADPNTVICPVCTGQPGTLPVANKMAVEMAIKTGLSLHSSIQQKSVFARKNYFYPDLPKGYQISQHNLPLCLGGYLNIPSPLTLSPKGSGEGEGVKRISLIRIHLEEDAGKLFHDFGHQERSHVDFNRCGVPLIEIVSGPDMRTPEEGGAYLRKLRNILVYLDVCEGNLQEGNFRCDANISMRPVGTEKLGTRTELKNLNSFKAVEKALAYEIERQTKLLSEGKEVMQETLLWNDNTGKTGSMRTKEEAHDYRYFSDPDLLPLIVDNSWIENVRKTLPELADAKAARFVKDYGITEYDAAVLTEDKSLSDYFEIMVRVGTKPKIAANWILGEFLRILNELKIKVEECKIKPDNFVTLIKAQESSAISASMAKEVLSEIAISGKPADDIIKAKGFSQISDVDLIEQIVEKVIQSNQKQVGQYKAGKTALFAFFVGQVMKETKGQANPKIVNELLKKKLI